MSLISNYESTAKDYDKGRLDYPLDSVQKFLTALEYKPSDKVCDLGAGTGKLTSAMLEIAPDVDIVAVEPSPEMGRIFAEKFSSIPLLQSSAEAIPLPDASVDIVVVGTAFHWFANKQALAEIARILKPNGRLGLIWNILDRQVSLVRELYYLLDYKRSAKNFHKTHDALEWRDVFVGQYLFTPLKHSVTHYTYTSVAEDIVNRMLASKIVGAFGLNEITKLRDNIRVILHAHNLDPQAFAMPYRVEMYWTEKVKP